VNNGVCSESLYIIIRGKYINNSAKKYPFVLWKSSIIPYASKVSVVAECQNAQNWKRFQKSRQKETGKPCYK
jgi:hypothetical protein